MPKTKASLPTRNLIALTSYKGKEIAKPLTPPSGVSFERKQNSQTSRNKNVDILRGTLNDNQDWTVLGIKRQVNVVRGQGTEIDEQELEAHYSYMARFRRQLVETVGDLMYSMIGCLVALQNKTEELRRYKAFNVRTEKKHDGEVSQTESFNQSHFRSPFNPHHSDVLSTNAPTFNGRTTFADPGTSKKAQNADTMFVCESYMPICSWQTDLVLVGKRLRLLETSYDQTYNYD
ncbi:hypothetical protein Tco_0426338 [Tanacetum coccineum]